ncbi:MAG TPA: BTAD domain-containing putative transcriptional regulator [Intrasporangium sp.]|uniref:AfsR/SARP family transcriptional regulator n=1 Tax=Intrasporangium sp. TaxID=1925024 RepID=UPI002D78C8F4|nr:BTAD domain-containing putative transcriptional regulator [Intrasporangium sp.]HET7399948.1 BTAD domain-containing putative transcriptional regulator [Intrasporangium sp.]
MSVSHAAAVPRTTAGPAKLSLLGGFSLQIEGEPVALPLHARRVMAYLSLDKLRAHDCDRRVLAERLWADASSDRCRGSLRTALWRIRSADSRLVRVSIDRVWLADEVEVDVHRLRRQAQRTLAEDSGELELPQLLVRAEELLPGWDEDWLLLAREQLRQMRLHAAEVTARRLRERGRYTEAIDVMLAVVAEEPLRESAQGALIDAHLAEGNVFEARRQLVAFTRQLWAELGLRPSSELFRKVGVPCPPLEQPVERRRAGYLPTT